jgi:hypothetical protein
MALNDGKYSPQPSQQLLDQIAVFFIIISTQSQSQAEKAQARQQVLDEAAGTLNP